MAAAKISGKTTIKFASANYQVQDLCFYLMKFGVQIEGIGTTTLMINGVPEIKQDMEYCPSEDQLRQCFSFPLRRPLILCFAIKRCPIDFLELELLKLEKMGFKYKILKHYKANNGFTNLVDIKHFRQN